MKKLQRQAREKQHLQRKNSCITHIKKLLGDMPGSFVFVLLLYLYVYKK